MKCIICSDVEVAAMSLKSRTRISQRLHGASYIQHLTLCSLAVHLDPSRSLSLSGKFRMQTSSLLSVTRDFLSTAGCSSAEFGACLFLAFIGPGLEASPIRFPSKPVHVSVELDFDRSFGIFDMNVVVQIDNKINAKSLKK